MADVEAAISKQEEAAATAAASGGGAGAPPPDVNEPPPPYQPGYGPPNAVPPSYEQAGPPPDAPPSYDSLFGQVRAAKQSSSGIGDFFKKFLIIVIGTVGCTICVGLVLAIPISMIVIGSKYLDQCPAERYIPIYLIVGGCFGVIKNLSNMCQRVKNHNDSNEEENTKTNPIDSLLSCFLLAWFIAGNVWIYRTYNNFTTEEVNIMGNPNPNYCHPVLYYYAFWITTASYILMGSVCFCICCAGIFAAIVGERND